MIFVSDLLPNFLFVARAKIKARQARQLLKAQRKKGAEIPIYSINYSELNLKIEMQIRNDGYILICDIYNIFLGKGCYWSSEEFAKMCYIHMSI